MSNPESLGSSLPSQMRKKWRDLDEFAAFCYPEGSVIECRRCHIKRNCTTSEIATWMKEGYPVCRKCGHKTELVNIHVRRMDFE